MVMVEDLNKENFNMGGKVGTSIIQAFGFFK